MDALLYVLVILCLFTPLISWRGALGSMTSALLCAYTLLLLYVKIGESTGYDKTMWLGTGLLVTVLFIMSVSALVFQAFSWWRREKNRIREPEIPW